MSIRPFQEENRRCLDFVPWTITYVRTTCYTRGNKKLLIFPSEARLSFARGVFSESWEYYMADQVWNSLLQSLLWIPNLCPFHLKLQLCNSKICRYSFRNFSYREELLSLDQSYKFVTSQYYVWSYKCCNLWSYNAHLLSVNETDAPNATGFQMNFPPGRNFCVRGPIFKILFSPENCVHVEHGEE